MKRSCKYKKQEKGVTLIILVATVIIMLILAGVTINIVFGEGGALQQSQKTQKLQEESANGQDKEVDTLINSIAKVEPGEDNDNDNENNHAPSATITVEATEVLSNGAILVKIEQEDEDGDLFYKKCRYVWNKSGEALGLDESAYTDGVLSNQTVNLSKRIDTTGTYYLHALTVDVKGNAIETISSPVTVVKSIYNYSANNATNPYYTFTAPADGVYRLEVYGAQGGSYSETFATGGKGGRVRGDITLKKGTNLYIYVGRQGSYGTTTTYNVMTAGGYNGGGAAAYRGGTGGGATDMRFVAGAWNDSASLLSRVIVGGGGGGAFAYSSTYKADGGYSGKAGSAYSTSYTAWAGGGATLTAGGTAGTGSSTNYNGKAGTFGVGASTGYKYNNTSYYSNGAGGGGWYGGGSAGNYSGAAHTRGAGGGGGSNFAWTSANASRVPTGYSVGSEYYLTNTTTTVNSGSGDGKASIEISSITSKSSTTTGLGWDTSKIKVVNSKDEIPVKVPVPVGFVASEATGENTVKGGFVIYQGTEKVNDANVETAQKTRNQFVWVPIDDEAYSKMIDETNHRGNLYNFTTSGTTPITYSATGYREPDTVTSSTSISGTKYNGDDVASHYSDADIRDKEGNLITGKDGFQTLLQTEFNEMAESVKKYKGFYIGRYETGNLQAVKNTIPVVQKGNTNIGDVNWYYMYANSKNIAKSNDNIKTSMIWGCQWDATLDWLVATNGGDYSLVTDSSSWGNYKDQTFEYKNTDGTTATKAENAKTKIPTGSTERNKKNNIYDMAGNVNEWTIEANSTSYRDLRRRQLRL